MFSCYRDGCMTPEEFVDECARELEMEEEERHGDNTKEHCKDQ